MTAKPTGLRAPVLERQVPNRARQPAGRVEAEVLDRVTTGLRNSNRFDSRRSAEARWIMPWRSARACGLTESRPRLVVHAAQPLAHPGGRQALDDAHGDGDIGWAEGSCGRSRYSEKAVNSLDYGPHAMKSSLVGHCI